ncbi:Serine/threonine-protein phosphatase 2A regulatory subunit B'' subunit alpha [Sarcoptes scabiei]|uniref:Serine/threonine-protein phosphatase 2A regulatory subunit B'' subunit alpha n=1 Tax=Sarcoptes scabiei TaxID=52283 RepID=A0A834RCP8_SARSC|nr:Serine/threonine-protein phosphatase 2A regulatory subunit B'' subunit alpha [Sarcoptes scabiei]
MNFLFPTRNKSKSSKKMFQSIETSTTSIDNFDRNDDRSQSNQTICEPESIWIIATKPSRNYSIRLERSHPKRVIHVLPEKYQFCSYGSKFSNLFGQECFGYCSTPIHYGECTDFDGFIETLDNIIETTSSPPPPPPTSSSPQSPSLSSPTPSSEGRDNLQTYPFRYYTVRVPRKKSIDSNTLQSMKFDSIEDLNNNQRNIQSRPNTIQRSFSFSSPRTCSRNEFIASIERSSRTKIESFGEHDLENVLELALNTEPKQSDQLEDLIRNFVRADRLRQGSSTSSTSSSPTRSVLESTISSKSNNTGEQSSSITLKSKAQISSTSSSPKRSIRRVLSPEKESLFDSLLNANQQKLQQLQQVCVKLDHRQQPQHKQQQQQQQQQQSSSSINESNQLNVHNNQSDTSVPNSNSSGRKIVLKKSQADRLFNNHHHLYNPQQQQQQQQSSNQNNLKRQQSSNHFGLHYRRNDQVVIGKQQPQHFYSIGTNSQSGNANKMVQQRTIRFATQNNRCLSPIESTRPLSPVVVDFLPNIPFLPNDNDPHQDDCRLKNFQNQSPLSTSMIASATGNQFKNVAQNVNTSAIKTDSNNIVDNRNNDNNNNNNNNHRNQRTVFGINPKSSSLARYKNLIETRSETTSPIQMNFAIGVDLLQLNQELENRFRSNDPYRFGSNSNHQIDPSNVRRQPSPFEQYSQTKNSVLNDSVGSPKSSTTPTTSPIVNNELVFRLQTNTKNSHQQQPQQSRWQKNDSILERNECDNLNLTNSIHNDNNSSNNNNNNKIVLMIIFIIKLEISVLITRNDRSGNDDREEFHRNHHQYRSSQQTQSEKFEWFGLEVDSMKESQNKSSTPTSPTPKTPVPTAVATSRSFLREENSSAFTPTVSFSSSQPSSNTENSTAFRSASSSSSSTVESSKASPKDDDILLLKKIGGGNRNEAVNDESNRSKAIENNSISDESIDGIVYENNSANKNNEIINSSESDFNNNQSSYNNNNNNNNNKTNNSSNFSFDSEDFEQNKSDNRSKFYSSSSSLKQDVSGRHQTSSPSLSRSSELDSYSSPSKPLLDFVARNQFSNYPSYSKFSSPSYSSTYSSSYSPSSSSSSLSSSYRNTYQSPYNRYQISSTNRYTDSYGGYSPRLYSSSSSTKTSPYDSGNHSYDRSSSRSIHSNQSASEVRSDSSYRTSSSSSFRSTDSNSNPIDNFIRENTKFYQSGHRLSRSFGLEENDPSGPQEDLADSLILDEIDSAMKLPEIETKEENKVIENDMMASSTLSSSASSTSSSSSSTPSSPTSNKSSLSKDEEALLRETLKVGGLYGSIESSRSFNNLNDLGEKNDPLDSVDSNKSSQQHQQQQQQQSKSDQNDSTQPTKRRIIFVSKPAPKPEPKPEPKYVNGKMVFAQTAHVRQSAVKQRGSVAERVMLFEKCPDKISVTKNKLTEIQQRNRLASPNKIGQWFKMIDSHAPPENHEKFVKSNLKITSSSTSKASIQNEITSNNNLFEKNKSGAGLESFNDKQQQQQQKQQQQQEEEDQRLKDEKQQPTIKQAQLSSSSSTAAAEEATSTPSIATAAAVETSKPTKSSIGSIPTFRRTISRQNSGTIPGQLPKFYYPSGRPNSTDEVENQCKKLTDALKRCSNSDEIDLKELGDVMKQCSIPFYWKDPLFRAVSVHESIVAGGKNGIIPMVNGDPLSNEPIKPKDKIKCDQLVTFWRKLLTDCHDDESKFIRILTRNRRSFLIPEDFETLLQDVIDTHPGLLFLKEAEEFHSRYIHTVIARIFYTIDRKWSGTITLPELRKSNLLKVIQMLETEDDINQITEYFSYEHFYVIYCKFWELDQDHDLFISKQDLSKHNDSAISSRMIDRIFSGAVTRTLKTRTNQMSYTEFVWFLLAEEDKRHPRAIEYWFRCMDLDGDGCLSYYELEYFYSQQVKRMEASGIEALPFTDCLCQMIDLVSPKDPSRITLADLKNCRLTPIFFDTFFNLEKYLDHEQRDPFASQRDEDGVSMSDWDRFAAEEYELLVAEESAHSNSSFRMSSTTTEKSSRMILERKHTSKIRTDSYLVEFDSSDERNAYIENEKDDGQEEEEEEDYDYDYDYYDHSSLSNDDLDSDRYYDDRSHLDYYSDDGGDGDRLDDDDQYENVSDPMTSDDYESDEFEPEDDYADDDNDDVYNRYRHKDNRIYLMIEPSDNRGESIDPSRSKTWKSLRRLSSQEYRKENPIHYTENGLIDRNNNTARNIKEIIANKANEPEEEEEEEEEDEQNRRVNSKSLLPLKELKDFDLEILQNNPDEIDHYRLKSNKIKEAVDDDEEDIGKEFYDYLQSAFEKNRKDRVAIIRPIKLVKLDPVNKCPTSPSTPSEVATPEPPLSPMNEKKFFQNGEFY